MRPKVLITRKWPSAVEAELVEKFDVTLNNEDIVMQPDQLHDAMLRYDVICPTVTDKMNAEILSIPNSRVKLIANFGAGYEHIDLVTARSRGITVTNTPDVLTDATADMALLLMLMTSRRAWEGATQLRQGKWVGWGPTHMVGQSLAGKTLGLVGFGRIAQATAAKARAALGMKVIYHSRTRHAASDAQYFDKLDDMVANADVVSLHCPGGAETHHLVNSALIKKMKRTAILINTARGSVVNEAELATELANATIAAAGLDVFEHEPNIHPELLKVPNAVLLPHLGSATIETREAMGCRVLKNMTEFFAGDVPHDRVA